MSGLPLWVSRHPQILYFKFFIWQSLFWGTYLYVFQNLSIKNTTPQLWFGITFRLTCSPLSSESSHSYDILFTVLNNDLCLGYTVMDVVSSCTFLCGVNCEVKVCCEEFGNKTSIFYPELFLCDWHIDSLLWRRYFSWQDRPEFSCIPLNRFQHPI